MRGWCRSGIFLALMALCPCFPGASLQAAGGAQDETDFVAAFDQSVVYLANDSNDKYITGTLFYSSGPIVLTNYHVLSSTGDMVRVYLNTSSGRVEQFSCEFLKGDRLLDMAVFRIALTGKTREELADGGFIDGGSHRFTIPATNRYIPHALFARRSDIRRGERVVFLGFPLNYGITFDAAERKLLKKPLVRAGLAASEVEGDEFLIDAMVSNGNSGSPVFIRSASGKGEYRFAGIIKEFQHDTISYRIGVSTVRVPHNTGLGIVIPSDEIERFLPELR